MNVVCLQEKLKYGVETVERISGKHVTLPILEHILLETETGGIRLTATDLEIGISTSIPGKVEKEGAVTVPAKLLNNFLSIIPKKKIVLQTQDQTLILKTETHKATFFGEKKDNFPLLPRIKKKNSLALERQGFLEGLSLVEKSSAFSDSRPELAGVFLSYDKGKLVLAATDSFRLSETTLSIKGGKLESFVCILPARTVQEVVRVFSSTQDGNKNLDTIDMFIENNQVLFESGGTHIISRLIEGEYPQYQAIIPKTFEMETVLNREVFLRELKLGSLFAGRNNELTIEIDPERSQVFIRAENSGVGESASHIPCSAGRAGGKKLAIVFNYKYLIDGLSHVSGENVVLKTNSEANPVLVTASPETAYRYLVMPVRTTTS